MSKRGNTVEKGNAFEDRVYNILHSLLKNDEFALNSKKSKLFKKKKYKSCDGTDSTIEIDVSIETYLNKDSKPSILTLIECKDYSHSVDVSEVRDFYGRILQLNAHKGIMFSTAKFQEGAYKYANAKNIGLVRVSPDESIEWILHRISIKEQYKIDADIKNYVIDRGKESESYNFGAVFGSRIYTNIYGVLSDELGLIKHNSLKVQHLSVERIKEVLYEKIINKETHTIIFNEDLEAIVKKIGYRIEYKQTQEGVLGSVDFNNKIITLSNTLTYGDVRWRFSIAHEIGHIVLHSKLLSDFSIKEISESSFDNVTTHFDDKNLLYLERQANRFAALLLISEQEFTKAYKNYHSRNPFRRFPYLYLDSQPCNITFCNEVFVYMANHFHVSKEAIKIQFEQLNLLTIDSQKRPPLYRV